MENASGKITKPNSAVANKRDLLGEPAEMQTHERQRLQIFKDKVAVAGRIHRICGRCSEAQFARGNGAIKRERCSGNGSRSQRAIVEARGAIPQARRIAQDHFDIGQKPVRNQHRLRALQVRVAGHHGLARRVCLIDKGTRPRSKAFDYPLNLGADVEPQVGGDLFVAAAACVQLEPQRADTLHQRQLDIMMDVFGRRMIAHHRFARFRSVVRRNRVQCRPQLRGFTFGQDPGREKGGRVRLAGGYVFRE